MIQTNKRFLSGGSLLAGLLIGMGCVLLAPPLSAAVGLPAQSQIQRQIQAQGRMLLGNLRQAREMGLRGDPWAMSYALHEAHRLLDQLSLAEQSLRDGESSRQPANAPLDERLDIGIPLSGGRWQRLADLEQAAASIPLHQVKTAVDQASRLLHARPPALGRALLVTNQALSDIHWQSDLETTGWSRSRDLVLQGYAMALDHHRTAFDKLAEAQHSLRTLPGAGSYGRRLDTLLRAPTLQLGALRTLVQDLDHKVQTIRKRAERVRLERSGMEL